MYKNKENKKAINRKKLRIEHSTLVRVHFIFTFFKTTHQYAS